MEISKFKISLFSLFLPLCVMADYSNESELTTVITGGNTVQELWNAKTLNTYELNKNIFKVSGHYTYGKSDKDLTARNWDLVTKYERALSKSWSSFASVQYLEDNFANIDYKWNYDIGGLYYFLKTDKMKLSTEFGGRRTIESSNQGEKDNSSKMRLYTELSHKKSKALTYKVWGEAIRNLSQSDDWELSIEPSLAFALSNTFAIKLAYLYKYDNEPAQGTVKQDYKYTTSLIAKF